ncbi:head GIN domain-containing protein [Methanobacterium sp.]|uniref:head GIN domain-containing protein n=1 Tax=Methanobacterium sp. TaxID=2164 RepID=UPI003C794950
MKKYIIAALIILAVIAVSGCTWQNVSGSGNVINQSQNVSGFNQVSVDGSGTLIITQGDKESLTIEAEDNLMQYIKTNISSNALNIHIDKSIAPTKPIKYYLTVKDLNSITYSGGGKIQSNGLKTNSLTININGAAEGNLTNLNVNTLKTIISGAGRLFMSGNANNQDIHVSGAGEFNAGNLNSKIVTITISGAGKGTIKVSNSLNAIVNGAGDISYIGNPQVTKQLNGAGDIKQVSG